MKVLVVGAGGREHALLHCLQRRHPSRDGDCVFVTPGNGGMSAEVALQQLNWDSVADPQFQVWTRHVRELGMDLVVVGPEAPLVDGMQDACRAAGIPCFGPSRRAAQLEASKAFCKDFLKRHAIPTARYETFTDYAQAKAYVEEQYGLNQRVVIKASGLAAGKGVLLPENSQQALADLHRVMVQREFGSAGDQVVVEEFLDGEECSVLAVTDGYTVVPFPAAQDHKRALDGDRGLNTGGMGAYAPAPLVTPALMQTIVRHILLPTVHGMRREGKSGKPLLFPSKFYKLQTSHVGCAGNPFVGVLYAGIMVTASGPRVLEFNCRFGDPETQVILPLLAEDCPLVDIMLACCHGCLDSVPVRFRDGYAATVVAASKGYPGPYPKNLPIELGSHVPGSVLECFNFPGISVPFMVIIDTTVYHAGTRIGPDGQLVTCGGRVLSVTGWGATLSSALERSYDRLKSISFDGMHYRRDIGRRALERLAQATSTPPAMTYADAGVSIDAGNSLVDKIKSVVRMTKRPGSDAEIGGFGGLFDLKEAGYGQDSLLVATTDGVGTKLKIAHAIGKHDTIGIDLVAMSVNDLVVQGAEPLLFLDYYACGRLQVECAQEFVAGVAQGCIQSGCALVGGETAEMPGMYQAGDYDVAGFAIGAVRRQHVLPRLLDMRAGDLVMGLPSSGVHSNGYSLVRHLVDKRGLAYSNPCPFDPTRSLGQALLEPTRVYVKTLLPLIQAQLIKGMAHITGGGFTDNIPRVLPDGLAVTLDASRWPILPVFRWLKALGGMTDAEMARTFNCGLGMILIVDAGHVHRVREMLSGMHEPVYEVGQVVHASQQANRVLVRNTHDWSTQANR